MKSKLLLSPFEKLSPVKYKVLLLYNTISCICISCICVSCVYSGCVCQASLQKNAAAQAASDETLADGMAQKNSNKLKLTRQTVGLSLLKDAEASVCETAA